MADFRADLRKRIDAVIAPWLSGTEKPPFSAKQLLAITLLSGDTTFSARGIYKWIMDNFEYYQYLIIYGFMTDDSSRSHSDVEDTRTKKARKFREETVTLLRSTSFPIEVEGIDRYPRFTMSAANAEALLAPFLKKVGTEPTTAFRFLELPAEIRNYIYELVFAYSRSGLRVSHGGSWGRSLRDDFEVLAAHFYDGFSFDKWHETLGPDTGRPYMLRTPRLSKILAPLLVSRQFYKEAMPIFYRINHFHCRSLGSLYKFLKYLPPNRRQHISQLSTSYSFLGWGMSFEGNVNAFKLLCQVKNLREFHLAVDEPRWTETKLTGGFEQYNGIMDLPGLEMLRDVKVEQVHFHGCPTVEKTLRSVMLRPAKVRPEQRITKKRKAAVDEPQELRRSERLKKARLS